MSAPLESSLVAGRGRDAGCDQWRVRLRGLEPAVAEKRFQAAQGLGVVWVPSMQWCPPLLGLVRRSQTRVRDPLGVASFMALIGALAVCKFLLRANRVAQIGLDGMELLEASVLSGWLLFFASSVLVSAMPFRWLLRFGSMLVACSVFVHHSLDDQAALLVSYSAPRAAGVLSSACAVRVHALYGSGGVGSTTCGMWEGMGLGTWTGTGPVAILDMCALGVAHRVRARGAGMPRTCCL
jgi:hypothetical protein